MYAGVQFDRFHCISIHAYIQTNIYILTYIYTCTYTRTYTHTYIHNTYIHNTYIHYVWVGYFINSIIILFHNLYRLY